MVYVVAVTVMVEAVTVSVVPVITYSAVEVLCGMVVVTVSVRHSKASPVWVLEGVFDVEVVEVELVEELVVVTHELGVVEVEVLVLDVEDFTMTVPCMFA